ncbi:MAG: IS66 family transposase [Anaerolineales bacterium]
MPTYDDLLEEIKELRQRCAEQERRIKQLERDNERLTELLEESRRAAKRQSAPFSKGEPKADPKKPGRKSGLQHGRHGHRQPPRPEQIDEVHEAPLPAACPGCHGPIELIEVKTQYQGEIPRRPIYRQFNVHIGRCCDCGRRVQGHHPLQTSDALGAAGSQLGAQAQAAVVQLNKDAGLSHGKVSAVFGSLFGLSLSRGAVARIVLRVAARLEPTYRAIERSMPAQPFVTPDETGWRVGGRRAWLHVLVGPLVTCYRIAFSRGYDVPESILGAGYQGQLIHDGWAPYDRFEQAIHQQCLAHLLERCRHLLEVATRGAVRFPRQVMGLLEDALDLRDRFLDGEVSDHGLAVARGRLRSRTVRLLKWPRLNAANERLAAHLARHEDQLFTFLEHPGLDATNWRAEQALRPAVVNRKVWGGNRTPDGAEAQSILMSVLRTCRQQQRDAFEFVSQVLCGRRPRLKLLPGGP